MLQDIEIDCGDDCERFIDGVWYAARVVSVDVDYVTVQYKDDGKTESDISKFSDEIRYSKFPDFNSVNNEEETPIAVDTPKSSDVVDSPVAVVTSMKRNLSMYRLDYNQLEYIFSRTVITPRTTSRAASHIRSKSFSSFLTVDRSSRTLICPRAGHLFAFRPAARKQPLERGTTGYASWGRQYINLLPLADLCVSCRRYTVYKCGRCNDTFYCSKACQKTNWAHHKVFCEPKDHVVMFRPNPALLSAVRPKKLVRCDAQALSTANSGFRTPEKGVKIDRYSGRNEATDAAFGRDGGATRRLWDKSTVSISTTVPIYDVRNSTGGATSITPSSSSSVGNVSHFHKISEAADDLDEQSGIHGHLRHSRSASSHASKDTQPEQWDYQNAYQKGTMSNGLAEEYGYGMSSSNMSSHFPPLAVSPLTVHGSSSSAVAYEPLHVISAHNSSNSMVTQDVISHTSSPVAGVASSIAGNVIAVPFDEDDIDEDDLEQCRRALTPTRHLFPLDTHSINGFRSSTNGAGNPFVVNHRPGGVVSEDDFAMDDDDEDGMPSLAAVAPAPASLAPPREGGGSPLFAKPYNAKSVTMSAAYGTPERPTAGRQIEVVDLELEDQIRNLVMELGLNEKSLRMALKLFSNDFDRAVEWVYDNPTDYDMDWG